MKKEFRDLIVEDIEEANILLLGIPFDKNASVGKGASLAPKVLRELSFDLPAVDMRGIPLNDTKIYDLGDETSEDFQTLKENIYQKLMHSNQFKLILGGDHSIAIPAQEAFYQKAKELNKVPVIIHLDAHPDICESYHDSKYSHACPIKRSLDVGFEDKNITLIGIRGFEKEEVETLKKHHQIDCFKAVDVKEIGVDAILTILQAKYQRDNYLIYLSYDIDINDPSFAPGTGTPEAFGLNSSETLKLVLGIISLLDVYVMDLVEIAPPLDINNITSWLGLKTLYEVFKTLELKRKDK